MRQLSLLEEDYSNNDRIVIIHADDIGMCQSSVQAFADLWNSGMVTSGTLMTPCAWFPAAAQMCRENPEMDMGVHVTLNAEWTSYRWGPVSTRDQASGLMDADGYFPQSRADVYQNANPLAVAVEVHAQAAQAFAAGVDVSHVDSHMGTVLNPKFIESYVQAAQERSLPAMLPRMDAVGFEMFNFDTQALKNYEQILERVELRGGLTLNGVMMMPLDQPTDQMETAKKLLGGLPQGITHFIFHPAVDTPELRAICPDWQSRVENYRAFMNDDMKKFVESENIKLIGYRTIRDAMRNKNDE